MGLLTGLFMAAVFSMSLVILGRAVGNKPDRRSTIIAQIKELKKRKAELEMAIAESKANDPLEMEINEERARRLAEVKSLVDVEKETALNKVMSWADEEQKRLEALYNANYDSEIAKTKSDLTRDILGDLQSLRDQIAATADDKTGASMTSISRHIESVIEKLGDPPKRRT